MKALKKKSTGDRNIYLTEYDNFAKNIREQLVAKLDELDKLNEDDRTKKFWMAKIMQKEFRNPSNIFKRKA